LVGLAVYFQATARKPVAISPGSSDVAQDDSDDERQGWHNQTPVIELTWPESGLADFKFTDRSGEVISKNDLLGTPWIASFVFINCAGPCPRVTEAVKILHDHYRDKPLKFVTFTVDPKRDTVEALKGYADAYGADPDRWYFLTGERDELYSLIKGSFLMPVGEAPKPVPGYEIIHTTNICLVDSTGRVVGKYNSTNGPEIAELRRDLRRMLQFPVPGFSNSKTESGIGSDQGASDEQETAGTSE
jgi:cytochrome oxidase Cu insertion factor (SCO1/SenC/PrrC family)